MYQAVYLLRKLCDIGITTCNRANWQWLGVAAPKTGTQW